jgi:folate-binding protein YgfZ
MVITAGDGAAIRQALDRVLFPADAVTLGPVTPARLITVEGAEAIPDLPAAGDAGGGGRWLPGARLLLRAEDACPPWLEALPVLGAPEAERWRLSQGRPAAPAEINDEVNPFELGLADRVSLNKGCYVGQETLAKLATYDGVKQQLRRWVWTAQDPGAEPERMLLPGAPLTTAAGERAGRISSVLALPADGGQPARWIGLALVRRGVLESDTLLAGAGFPLRISLPDGFQPPPGSGSGR